MAPTVIRKKKKSLTCTYQTDIHSVRNPTVNPWTSSHSRDISVSILFPFFFFFGIISSLYCLLVRVWQAPVPKQHSPVLSNAPNMITSKSLFIKQRGLGVQAYALQLEKCSSYRRAVKQRHTQLRTDAAAQQSAAHHSLITHVSITVISPTVLLRS